MDNKNDLIALSKSKEDEGVLFSLLDIKRVCDVISYERQTCNGNEKFVNVKMLFSKLQKLKDGDCL